MNNVFTQTGFRWLTPLVMVILLGGIAAPVTYAQDEAETPPTEVTEETTEDGEEESEEAPAEVIFVSLDDVNVLWTCLAAFLVFFMQAGFALVEAGFTRAKNACNIIMKNLMDLSVGSLSFWLVGFGLMFGLNDSGYIGTSGFMFDANADDAILGGRFGWAFLIFQTVFAATAATIVSGAMAERTKFGSYMIYSVAITVIVYPIFGSWCWNGLVESTGAGWLESRDTGFYDFAGSTVVHSIGGWCALAGAIVIGARRGKYKDGKPMPIQGHNLPMAALGVFILWLGWFGFNPGSTTGVDSNLAEIAVATNLSAAAGATAAMILTWILFKKPDVSFALNGALAGLVAITAGCDVMSPMMSIVTGAVGGVIVVFSCMAIEKAGIDDPVGAVSVHGVCGAWGTIAVGLLSSVAGKDQLISQCVGVGAGFLWAFPVSFIIFYVIKVTVGLRVSEEEEMEGLDLVEHGMTAYGKDYSEI